MTEISSRDTLAILATAIPGFLTMQARHPINKGVQSVADIIVNLNDSQRWSREEIADWLDSLNLDLEIRPFDEVRSLNGCGCGACQMGGGPYSQYVLSGYMEPVSLEGTWEPEPLKVAASDVVYPKPKSYTFVTSAKSGMMDFKALELKFQELLKSKEPNKEEK